MKKTHFVLLIVTILMALFSAYSLAAINQVYKINFEWYSQYHKTYTGEYRDLLRDKWVLKGYPEDMKFYIIKDNESFLELQAKYAIKDQEVLDTDLDKNIMIFCSLGEVGSPEYRIKVMDIAQRGNVVEVKVSLNSATKLDDNSIKAYKYVYYPSDVIRIDKTAFPIKGKLNFIIKNQDGEKLFEESHELR